MQDGWSTFLQFFAVSTSAGKSGYLEDLGVAVLHCVQCLSTRFGYPNDEGLPEHPLYKHGLDQFGSEAVEVLNFPWAAEIDGQAQRSVERIWGSRGISIPGEPRKSRHFILPFKKATFECLAEDIVGATYAPDFQAAYAWVQQRFAEH